MKDASLEGPLPVRLQILIIGHDGGSQFFVARDDVFLSRRSRMEPAVHG